MTDPTKQGGPAVEGDALAGLEALVRRRRTNLRVDAERPVPEDLVRRLCEAATWAPNHHRTWPWRFAALTGDARARLGAALAAHLRAAQAPPEKVAKAEGKYLRAPVLLAVAVGHRPDDGPVRRAEDRDAVAAGVQNLLLAATAAGLASYWGSGEVLGVPAVLELCGFAPSDTVVALIYLGYPLADVAAPPRPAPDLRFIA